MVSDPEAGSEAIRPSPSQHVSRRPPFMTDDEARLAVERGVNRRPSRHVPQDNPDANSGGHRIKCPTRIHADHPRQGKTGLGGNGWMWGSIPQACQASHTTKREESRKLTSRVRTRVIGQTQAHASMVVLDGKQRPGRCRFVPDPAHRAYERNAIGE